MENKIINIALNCPIYSQKIDEYSIFFKFNKENVDQMYAAHLWSNEVCSKILPILGYLEDVFKSSLVSLLIKHRGEHWYKYLNTYKLTQMYEGLHKTKFYFWIELLKIDNIFLNSNDSVFRISDYHSELFNDNLLSIKEFLDIIELARNYRNNIVHHTFIWKLNPNYLPNNIHECIRELKKNYLLFFNTIKRIDRNKASFFCSKNIIDEFEKICSINHLNQLIYLASDHILKNLIDNEIHKIIKSYKSKK